MLDSQNRTSIDTMSGGIWFSWLKGEGTSVAVCGVKTLVCSIIQPKLKYLKNRWMNTKGHDLKPSLWCVRSSRTPSATLIFPLFDVISATFIWFISHNLTNEFTAHDCFLQSFNCYCTRSIPKKKKSLLQWCLLVRHFWYNQTSNK